MESTILQTFAIVTFLVSFVVAILLCKFEKAGNADKPATRRRTAITNLVAALVAGSITLAEFKVKQSEETRTAEEERIRYEGNHALLDKILAENRKLRNELQAGEGESIGLTRHLLARIEHQSKDCAGCVSNLLPVLADFVQGLANSANPDTAANAERVLVIIRQTQTSLNTPQPIATPAEIPQPSPPPAQIQAPPPIASTPPSHAVTGTNQTGTNPTNAVETNQIPLPPINLRVVQP